MAGYYKEEDLPRFAEMSEGAPRLWEKFNAWYSAVFESGALTQREKSLIALAVAHALECPYCIDAYTRDCLEKGSNLEQMTEAVHVASAIKGGLGAGPRLANAKRGSEAEHLTLTVGLSLQAARHPLASPAEQLRVLGNGHSGGSVRPFEHTLADSGIGPLTAGRIEVFQVNVGKLCNQTCKHCHVDAGPDRSDEMMSRETFDLCLNAIRRIGHPTVDITGGAPELNPNFRWFVKQVRSLGCHAIDRCNLTVLTIDSQRGLADFLARHQVEIIASLPYFLQSRTDAQRGAGVFEKSIKALRLLNARGYGIPGSGLQLNLVYNPTGAFLPPDQGEIESDFRRELRKRHGIEFTSLFTLTNMPISRYLEFLVRSGKLPALHGTPRQRLQPRSRIPGDVPLDDFRRLGRAPV